MNEISPFLTTSIPYATAFLAGLMGGVHCIGMCGGVIGLLATTPGRRVSVDRLLAYNLGRITTYVGLGAVVGATGGFAGDVLGQYQSWTILRVVAGVFMVAMGLYIGGWWFGLTQIEKGGAIVWRRISPFTSGLLPARSFGNAWVLGVLWGWLPCGLVYTTLVWALASGGSLQGAGFMFSFGLGTLPVLLFAGMMWADAGARRLVRRFKPVAGATVILFGVWTAASAAWLGTNVGLGCVAPP